MNHIENQWQAVAPNDYGITRARVRWDEDSDWRNCGWVLDTDGKNGVVTDGASPDTYHNERNDRGAAAALRASLWHHYWAKLEGGGK